MMDMQTTTVPIFQNLRMHLDRLQIWLSSYNRERQAVIARHIPPSNTAELQLAIEEQYQLMEMQAWHQREIELARAELAQQDEHDAQVEMLAPQIQTHIQQTLAAIEEQKTRRMADVDTQRLTTTREEREALDLLQVLADGKSRATVEVPTPAPEQYGLLLHDCNCGLGESLQACAERGTAEFVGKYKEYGRYPKMLYVSPDDNLTLSFFDVSLPRRESGSLKDGCMIVEG